MVGSWPEPRSPRGETPQEILNRLAQELKCRPNQVADKVIEMLKERAVGK